MFDSGPKYCATCRAELISADVPAYDPYTGVEKPTVFRECPKWADTEEYNLRFVDPQRRHSRFQFVVRGPAHGSWLEVGGKLD